MWVNGIEFNWSSKACPRLIIEKTSLPPASGTEVLAGTWRW
jgi:hypothetical protein